MMSQRFNLFYAGYTAYAPSLYFNQLALTNGNVEHSEEKIKACLLSLSKKLKDDEDENISNLKTAASIGKQFELGELTIPFSYVDYFPWVAGYTDLVEKNFPMSRIDHYYFLYARKIAEIMSNIGLVECYLSLHLDTDKCFELHSGINKCFKDTEFILFKLIASAALLSSEPRHSYFNANYKQMNGDYKFRGIQIESMSDSELQNLKSQLTEYRYSVKDGLKKCIGVLKELQI